MEQLKFELYEDELISPLMGHRLSDIESFIASLLLDARSESPLPLKSIIRRVNDAKGVKPSERTVKSIIRALRKEHAFPILSRRKPPAGYWWCGSAAEMEAFIQMFKSQAMDELHTLSKIVKQTYPYLAGQLKFDEAA